MPTSPTLIDALPDAPNRSMSDEDFVEAADAWVAAQPDFRTQINSVATTTYNNAVEAEADAEAAEAAAAAAEGAQAGALGANTRTATSASSHSFTAGSKAFVMVETGRTFAHPMEVVAYRASDVSARMYGSTDSIAGQTLTASFTTEGIVGSGGPFTNWVIADAGFFQTGATPDEVRAMSSDLVGVTPGSIADALAEVTLTNSGTTIITSGDAAVDMSKLINAAVTLAGNWTLPNPTNKTVGKSGRIRGAQDGTGGRTLAFGSEWKRRKGSPTAPPTTASAEFYIEWACEKSNVVAYTIVELA